MGDYEEKSKGSKKFRLNVRSELLFMLAINGVLIGNVKASVILVLVFFVGLLLVLLKRYETAFKYVFSYCVMYGGECLLMLLPQNAICNFIIVISSVMRKFIPYFMVGSIILETTTASMFLASLERWHIPKTFSIPFAVILRFFPSVKEEWNSITAAMKLRGIGLSVGNVLTHPMQTVEYILVPLLSSSIKIGDELSAASVARGLGMDRERTSVHDVRLCIWDYMLLVMAVVFFVLITFV